MDSHELTVNDVLWQLAPVKSKEALMAMSYETSPLNALSEYEKEKFISSVQFSEAGIGGYYYGGLEDELTPTQIYSILALIGKQNNVKILRNSRIETADDARLLTGSKTGAESHDRLDIELSRYPSWPPKVH
jgi:hypothetical protein